MHLGVSRLLTVFWAWKTSLPLAPWLLLSGSLGMHSKGLFWNTGLLMRCLNDALKQVRVFFFLSPVGGTRGWLAAAELQTVIGNLSGAQTSSLITIILLSGMFV